MKQKSKAKAASAPRKARAEPAEIVSATEAARMIDVTPRRLRQLVDEGHISRADRGRYVTMDVVHGYIRFLRDPRRAGDDDGRARLLALKADAQEAQLTRNLDQCMNANDAEQTFADILQVYECELSKIRLGKSVAKAVRAQIQHSLRRARNDFAAAMTDIRSGRGYKPG